MTDRYTRFQDLAADHRLGVDYNIRLKSGSTTIVVLAPHGGRIEPQTAEIAEAIAGGDHSFYAFEGQLAKGNRDLHITSNRFDEPRALKLISAADAAIAIHGRKDGGDPHAVWLGGRATALRDAIAISLGKAHFKCVLAPDPKLSGCDPLNICNRGSAGAGVQLELPKTLRDALACDPAKLRSFANAVREAVAGI